jgi:hypothetical protein
MENLRRISLNVYVRAREGMELPSQRDVENTISTLLLGMPRLDDPSRPGWDVSSTSIPESGQLLQDLLSDFPWNLNAGGKVHWRDPDGNVGKLLEIKSVTYDGPGWLDCIINIVHKGGELQVLPHELHEYEERS